MIQWNPIPEGSQGTNFRTHSAFVNDNWRVTSRLTANVGVRFDKNNGADSAGRLVAKDSAFSPRVGVSWDPTGDQTWSRHRQLREIRLRRFPTASPTRHRPPAIRRRTSSFTAVRRSTPTRSADRRPPPRSRRCSTGYNANGGANLPLNGAPTIPGVTPVRIQGSLNSPNNLEYAVGVSRQFGSRAVVRADYVVPRLPRLLRDSASTRARARVTRTSSARSTTWRSFENTNAVKRRYQGLTASRAPIGSPRRWIPAPRIRCRAPGATTTARTSAAARSPAARSPIRNTSRRRGPIRWGICRSISGTAPRCGSTTASTA